MQAEVDNGTPLQSIAVAGFSQGGCIALMMLRSKLIVSGIAGGNHISVWNHCASCVASGLTSFFCFPQCIEAHRTCACAF